MAEGQSRKKTGQPKLPCFVEISKKITREKVCPARFPAFCQAPVSGPAVRRRHRPFAGRRGREAACLQESASTRWRPELRAPARPVLCAPWHHGFPG